MRGTFTLALTQPMLELLCATADGVHTDRHLYFPVFGAAKPNNYSISENSLVKRGLIERVPKHLRKIGFDEVETDHIRLTPAGEALIALLRVAGIFVEADASVLKRSRISDKRGKR